MAGPARWNRRRIHKTIVYLVLTAISIVSLTPLLWMVTTAFKPTDEINVSSPALLPKHPTLDNFRAAFGQADFPLYIRNSFVYASLTTVCMLVFATMAGYAFARLRFRGRTVLFGALIALLLVPWETHLIPNFLLLRFFPLSGGNDIFGQGGSGLINTFGGLVLPGAVTPFGVFLMRQFFVSLPGELEEAARIDGASYPRIFARIMLPLSVPPLVTLGLLTFVATWNAFTWPLVVTQGETLRTVQLGLQVFKEANPVQPWGILMAASLISILPLVALFLVGQRYLVASMAFTGLKG
jgi:multiple sugar transport system permease protein